MDPIWPPSLSEVWLGLGLLLSERGTTLAAVADNRLLDDIETLHLDRGYDYPAVRDRFAALGLHDVCIQRRGTKTLSPDNPSTSDCAG